MPITAPSPEPAPPGRIFLPRLTLGVVIFLAVALLFAVASLSLSRSFEAETRSREEVRRTRDLVMALDAALLVMTDAESAQRGFLLTADEDYLTPYFASRQDFTPTLDRLAAAATAAGVPEADIAGLRAEAEAKMTELERTIGLARSGETTAALEVVRSDVGREAMASLRRRSDAMRDHAADNVERGFAAVAEVRKSTRDRLLLLGIAAAALLGLSAIFAFRTARNEARLRYLDEIEHQRDRADLVSRELSHRVKNLFAVIMSIISVTARSEADPRVAAAKTRERIQALARAHALSSGSAEMKSARLDELIEAVVAPYRPGKAGFEMRGESLLLPPRLITPMGLILNELATNALKYGAWSRENGTVLLGWGLTPDGELSMSWVEEAEGLGTAVPDRQGFGTRMIDLSLQQARAEIDRSWTESGLRAGLRFALEPAEIAVARPGAQEA